MTASSNYQQIEKLQYIEHRYTKTTVAQITGICTYLPFESRCSFHLFLQLSVEITASRQVRFCSQTLNTYSYDVIVCLTKFG